MSQYKIFYINGKIKIYYYGELSNDESNNIYIVCGFGNEWKKTEKKNMQKTDKGYYAEINKIDENIDTFNFCFCNENNVWDNNDSRNYTYYIKNEIIDNPILLISEVKNKVILPYKAEEILEKLIDDTNEFETVESVIEHFYTRDFKNYKNQFTARYRETMDLIVNREKMSKLDGINLAAELLIKKYLHPAIITACRNLDELNVYLDCMDKNELDDFKIFDIKYEVYPEKIKQNKIKELFEYIKKYIKAKTSIN